MSTDRAVPDGSIFKVLKRNLFRSVIRAIRSPFILSCLAITVGACFLPLVIGLGFIICIMLGMVLYPHHLCKDLVYEMAMIDSLTRDFLTKRGVLSQPYWTRVTDKLYLGALPLKNYNHLNRLVRKEKIQAVVSIGEDFELTRETFLSVPISEKDWNHCSIDRLRIIAEDMHALDLEEIKRTLSFIHSYERVYVHCKAGRGRSAIIVICYLMQYQNMKLEEAVSFVKKKRSVIRFQRLQKQNLKAFAATLVV